jgi:hypothetical protein
MALGQLLGGLLVPVIGTYAALAGVAAGLLLGSGLGLLAGRSQTQSRMTERVRLRG